MINRYDKKNPLLDLEGWIVFYGNQARRLENDPAMAGVFQASCETANLLLELKELREKVLPSIY
jgi:hypothetical protein